MPSRNCPRPAPKLRSDNAGHRDRDTADGDRTPDHRRDLRWRVYRARVPGRGGETGHRPGLVPAPAGRRARRPPVCSRVVRHLRLEEKTLHANLGDHRDVRWSGPPCHPARAPGPGRRCGSRIPPPRTRPPRRPRLPSRTGSPGPRSPARPASRRRRATRCGPWAYLRAVPEAARAAEVTAGGPARWSHRSRRSPFRRVGGCAARPHPGPPPRTGGPGSSRRTCPRPRG